MIENMIEEHDIPDLSVDFSPSDGFEQSLLERLLKINAENDADAQGEFDAQARPAAISLDDDDLGLLAAAGDLHAQEAERRLLDDEDLS